MVDELGLGVTVIAEAGHSFLDEWQSYLCWFAVRRYLPDALFKLAVAPSEGHARQLFQWTKRAKVPVRRSWPAQDGVTLRVPCYATLIRPFDPPDVAPWKGEVRPTLTPAKADGWAHWVDGRECGLFSWSAWIHRSDCPLHAAERFATADLSGSEDRVLRLWSQASSLFAQISRG